MIIFAMMLALEAPAVGSAATVQDHITKAVEQQLKHNPSTGAAVGVVRDGKLIYVDTFGFRNVAGHQAVDVQTRFEIGSVTKQFTAAAIMQLKEAGKLGLDDSLAKYLPAFPHANELTLRELLNQVSGLPDYLRGKEMQATSSVTKGSLDKVAALVGGNLNFPPGTQWQYSNTNYYVLGHVVEVVSGQSYEDYVRQHLFAPAGMNRSGFVEDESRLSDFATGYWQGDTGTQKTQAAPPILESWAGGAGCIVSTIADLMAWDNALANGTIVRDDDFTLMSSPGTLADGSKTAYGMGLGVGTLAGHRRIWHNGGSNGSLTMNATYPNDRIDIIVFENDLSGDPGQMEAAVFGVLFPDSVAAARRPVAGEDPAVRTRVLHILDETLRGATPMGELSPGFQKFATPAMQQRLAQEFAPFGAPTAVIFRGSENSPKGNRYTYRVQFAEQSALTFSVTIDKTTNLIDGIGIQPAV